jgi:hypothetical protein
MVKLHRDEIFDEEKRSEFLWCLHCERAYRRGEFRLVNVLQMCSYEDCDGDTVLDGWDWARIREGHPEYPEVPEKGKVYPLYS